MHFSWSSVAVALALAHGTRSQAVNPGYKTECVSRNFSSLTFDDGPYIWQEELTDLIASYGAKATYYVNGFNWGCIYDEANVRRLRHAFERGFSIGSHTWNHFDITTEDTSVLGAQLDLLETALLKILGIRPALFRPPYGAISDVYTNYLNSRGYTVVGWSDDSGDTNAAVSVEARIANVNALTGGDILLAHEITESTVKTVIPQTLPGLVARGLTFVNSEVCLNTRAYQAAPVAYGVRDATWTCAGTPAPGADPSPGATPAPPTTPPTAPSADGSCGPSNGGASCNGSPSGPCCSQWGWCGQGNDWCAAGCQVGWGTCN